MGPPHATGAAVPYFVASGVSAFACFPLWRAAAIGQSGFVLATTGSQVHWWVQALRPPWTGCLSVVLGMSWARGAIFYCSDVGQRWLQKRGHGPVISTALPAVLVSGVVQMTNQPFIRASITLQDPGCSSLHRCARFPTLSVLQHLHATRGFRSWWRGLSAATLKTVPKYAIAVGVKSFMERYPLMPSTGNGRGGQLLRSAEKSTVAAVAGALATNPLDVLRNEMFKTDESLGATFRRLHRAEGFSWMFRGCDKNLVAVAVPVGLTIFLTDVFSRNP